MDTPARKVTIYVSPFHEGSAGSHTLLREALRQYAGAAAAAAPLAFGPYGKPYLPDQPAVQFSITHSGDFWMCAFSDHAVGLDLQAEQDCDRARLSSRFFHPSEDTYLRQQSYAPFFALWAAKESYLKYTGQGITEDLSAFSVVAPNGVFPTAPGVCLSPLPWQQAYALCLCTNAPCTVRFCQLTDSAQPI